LIALRAKVVSTQRKNNGEIRQKKHQIENHQEMIGSQFSFMGAHKNYECNTSTRQFQLKKHELIPTQLVR